MKVFKTDIALLCKMDEGFTYIELLCCGSNKCPSLVVGNNILCGNRLFVHNVIQTEQLTESIQHSAFIAFQHTKLVIKLHHNKNMSEGIFQHC